VESFKSTLDEVRESDILLHVVDISHPNFEEQLNIVNETLREIGVADKQMIMVFNKIDAYQYVQKDEDDLSPETVANYTLDQMKRSWLARNPVEAIFISAKMKENIDELKDLLYSRVKELHVQRYPYNDFLY
jgi:GTP-binding protein HflX